MTIGPTTESRVHMRVPGLGYGSFPGVAATATIGGLAGSRAEAIDVTGGVSQRLITSASGGALMIKDLYSEHPGVLSSVSFGNTFEGAHVHATLTPPADVAWYPVETVSNSEAGFERQYQGSCLLLRWPLALRPGEARTIGVRFDVTSSRDRIAEERARRP